MTRVYLAVGHGDRDNGTHDPGAVGGGWTEQTAGDHIVAEAARILRSHGLTVTDEANRDDPNFPGTVRAANRWDADYVVEVHHDWIGAPPGAFGHWLSADGKALADDIQAAVGAAGFLLRTSWHKRRTDLYILKHTNAPCVLYEVGRIGHDVIDEPAELRDMGAAIATGILAHLDLSVTATPIEDDAMTAEQEAKLDRVLELLADQADELDAQDAVLNRIKNRVTIDGPRLRRGLRAVMDKYGLDVTEGP